MVYSKAEILTEKAFISGVCTNTPTTFTPIIRRPKIVAGYWKRRGSNPNPSAIAAVVSTPYATYNMVFTFEELFPGYQLRRNRGGEIRGEFGMVRKTVFLSFKSSVCINAVFSF